MNRTDPARARYEDACARYRRERRKRAKGQKTDRLHATQYAMCQSLTALMRAEVAERDGR
ncbi:MAG: hypothetical protein VX464_20785 [Pseudomonadota bacterium]|nr:hypothetical protein [Pseudomonadota bacterium]